MLYSILTIILLISALVNFLALLFTLDDKNTHRFTFHVIMIILSLFLSGFNFARYLYVMEVLTIN